VINCPNHGGSYDCTPFCELCAGNQEILPSMLLGDETKNITLTPGDLIQLGTRLLEKEISGMNLALVIDLLADEDYRREL
jgi:hypothetical protein